MIVNYAFSNGTEGHAWTSTWCDHCVHDHGQHMEQWSEGCELVLNSLVHESGEPLNPEAWVAEPDDGEYFLPSRMICLRFKPCYEDGCEGDPGEHERAIRISEVQAYWRERAKQ